MSGRSSPVAEFPYLPPSHRDLMQDLRSAVEARLGPHLLPSAVPPDVLSFHSPSGASRGALDIRSGGRDSPVDFILESWLHCELPTDLLPRKDLVLHPDYLDEFYQKTNLDKPRQELAKLPQVQPYCSSSLYIRSVLSPTAIAVCINCGEDGQSAMEDIMRGRLDTICKEIVRIWLDTCASSGKQLGDTERADLLRRDGLIKNKTIEIDLAANLPRMFSPEVANRVVGEIQKAFKI
ncbi:hypothetical protein OPV22_032721 [Ensete ventricosum]|uniref:Red chlorophyll catabolite reductase n=1 Tax=Ensete ventricosum TaxID=4639 RepID=A0AAV8PY38_ENSVE|nr:hypothetical protein OPV22_032721 [Ensete ventricosum]